MLALSPEKHPRTYTVDSKDASRDATPATKIVAWVNFCPVPPARPPSNILIAELEIWRGYDALRFARRIVLLSCN